LVAGGLNLPMSWEKAKAEAERWLAELKIPTKAQGQYFDLADKGETLKVEGGFRLMVLRAADRLIKKRGGSVNLPK